MQAGNDQMGSPRQCEETAIEDSDDDFSSTGGECIREETTGNTDMNKSTRTRREKRLAMNRESARKRRKENKVLMQSLEIRVAELSKSNQQYRHANESLSSIVQSLENELAQARSVIGRWTSVTSGNQLQLQQRFDPQAGLALIARSQPRRNEFGIFPSGIPAGAEVQLGDNLGRLRQAQLEQLTSQGGAAGLSLARAGTGSQFADASILRRHTLDALSRVTQTTDGSLGSLIRAPSFPSNAMSDFNNSYLRIPGSPLMVRPDVLQNVVS